MNIQKRTLVKRIWDWVSNKNFFKEIIFHAIKWVWPISEYCLEDSSIFLNARTDKFISEFSGKSIAIIWNAPNLSWNWEEIDNYDCVVRINAWGFSDNLNDDTGKKTDLHVIWSRKIMYEVIESKESINRVLVPKPCISMKALFEWLSDTFSDDWICFNESMKDFVELSRKVQAAGKRIVAPTTWLHTIDYFVKNTNFDELHLYWFTFSWLDHRIDTDRVSSYSSHAPERERKVVLDRMYNSTKTIRLHQ